MISLATSKLAQCHVMMIHLGILSGALEFTLSRSMTFIFRLSCAGVNAFKRYFSLTAIPISGIQNQAIRNTINTFAGIQNQIINRSYSSDKQSDSDKEGSNEIEESDSNIQNIKDISLNTENCFKVLCSKLFKKPFGDIKTLSIGIYLFHQETNTKERLGLYSEDPLFIAECSFYMNDLSPLKDAVRKRNFVERIHKQPCKTAVIANSIDPRILQKATKFAKDKNIILLHGSDSKMNK